MPDVNGSLPCYLFISALRSSNAIWNTSAMMNEGGVSLFSAIHPKISLNHRLIKYSLDMLRPIRTAEAFEAVDWLHQQTNMAALWDCLKRLARFL